MTNKKKRYPDDKRSTESKTSKNSNCKGKRSRSMDEPIYSVQNGENDWRWYADTPALAKAFGSYPFGYPVGSTVAADGKSYTIPGSMAFYYAPAVGNVQSENDPVNIAMRNIYTFVRHENSGATNYEAPDLMMYILAMSQVYAYYHFLVRVYKLARLYNYENRYYPKTLITQMGVDFEDVAANMAKFYGNITMFAVKAQRMCVPATMSYTARQMWMNDNIYMDGDTNKAQLYFYTPAWFWQYTEGTSTDAGSLQPLRFFQGVVDANTRQLLTVDDLYAYGNQLLNPILESQDMNTMSGDILKAYTRDGLMKLEPFAQNDILLPVYSKEVMSQFENLDIYHSIYLSSQKTGFTNENMWAVTQRTDVNTGYLESTPRVTMSVMNNTVTGLPADSGTYFYTGSLQELAAPYLATFKPLNFHWDPVDPTDVLVASRLMTAYALTGAFNYSIPGKVLFSGSIWCGSEVIIHANYSVLNPVTGEANFVSFATTTYGEDAVMNAAGDISSSRQLWTGGDSALRVGAAIAQFDWAPRLHLGTTLNFVPGTAFADITADSAALGGFSPLPQYDSEYYAILSVQNIRDLHATALLSEFSLPGANYA